MRSGIHPLTWLFVAIFLFAGIADAAALGWLSRSASLWQWPVLFGLLAWAFLLFLACRGVHRSAREESTL